jgi:hypothetical protein
MPLATLTCDIDRCRIQTGTTKHLAVHALFLRSIAGSKNCESQIYNRITQIIGSGRMSALKGADK